MYPVWRSTFGTPSEMTRSTAFDFRFGALSVQLQAPSDPITDSTAGCGTMKPWRRGLSV